MFALARYNTDGSLDRSFDHDGKVLTDFSSTSREGAHALAIDRSGQIVVGGYADDLFALARYNTDGSLDTSFDGDGKVLTDFSSTSREGAQALAIDRSGRIVVGGYADELFALARYNTDGSLDTSFDRDGKVLTDFRSTSIEAGRALAIDGSGRIVVGGYADKTFALARYNTNGSLDASFDGDGKVLTNFTSTTREEVYALAIDRSGRIVVGGYADELFALARYNTDGSLDRSFDRDGKVLTDFILTPHEAVQALAIDGSGRIVVGGTAYGQFALARYNTDGNLDTSFSADGKVLTNFTRTSAEGIFALALDGLGRIIVGGYADLLFALARYNTDGSLDRSFSGDGKVLTNFSSTLQEYICSVAVDSDDKIVVAGSALNQATS